MVHKTYSAFIDRNCSESEIKKLIEMTSANSAHIAFSVVDIAPMFPAYAYSYHYGGVAYSAEWQEELAERAEQVDKKADQVRKILQAESASGDVTTFFCEASQVEDLVAQRAALSDVAVISRTSLLDETLLDKVFSGIVFRSPVGVITAFDADKLSLEAEKVLIAWDAGQPATVAVHNALPILKTARELVVCSFDPIKSRHHGGEEPGADLARFLTRHGCSVEVQNLPSGGQEIGDCIMQHARESGAGMVVMGAYGHSKFREQLFGGTTRTMLEQNKLPVLFGH